VKTSIIIIIIIIIIIDRKPRKILTMYKVHHPKVDIDRGKKEGGDWDKSKQHIKQK